MLLWRLYKWWRARRASAAAEEPAPAPTGPLPTGSPLPKLFAASMKMLVRDRRTVLWSLAVPVIFAVIFGLIGFNRVQRVAVTAVPTGTSAFEQRLVAGLRRDPVFRVTVQTDLAAAQKRLRDGKGDVVLALPASRSSALVAYYLPNTTSNDFALGSVQRFVDATNLRLAGVTTPPVRLTEQAVAAKDTNYYDFLVPGLIGMAVMNLSIIGIAIAVTRYREQQILKRILATPLRPGLFLLAQVGTRLVLSLVQAAVILVLAVGAFGAHVHGDPVWLFVYAALGNLVFLNIGFTIAGRAKTTDSAQAMAQLVTLPMLFLSGTFFPTNGLPRLLELAVHALPLTPLIDAMRKISLDGDSVGKTLPQLGLLLAWVAVSLVFARRSFRFDEASPRSGGLRALLRTG